MCDPLAARARASSVLGQGLPRGDRVAGPAEHAAVTDGEEWQPPVRAQVPPLGLPDPLRREGAQLQPAALKRELEGDSRPPKHP